MNDEIFLSDKSSPFSLGSPHTPARLQQLTSYFSGVLDDFADENQDSKCIEGLTK